MEHGRTPRSRRPGYIPREIDGAGPTRPVPSGHELREPTTLKVTELRPLPASKPAKARLTKSTVLRRQMVIRAQEQRVKVKKAYKKRFFTSLLLVIVIGAFGLVGWSFRDILPFNLSIASDNNPSPANTATIQTESATLTEDILSPQQITENQVAENAPKTISIPKLDIKARVRHVGVTLNGEPVAPSNIFDVGWFQQSGLPGQPGAVLLNGHVSGPTMEGVFARAGQLVAGDMILLELGNGTMLTYQVEQVQQYSAGQIDMAAATNPIDPSKQGLNLVTTLNKYTGNDQRVIVFAVL